MTHWRAWALGCIAALAMNAAAAQSTLRIVLLNDLASLDPVQTTAGFARNHGFMVYDQLFALDSAGVPRPQMVESYTASADNRTWRFTLREGLAFHDGTSVTAADAVQSIRRWGERDVVGRALAAATASLAVVDARTFELTLSRPFALVTEALARSTASALFVMPERLARTPAATAITDATGSGPFVFQPDQWRAGERAVYARNRNYRPRSEPADGLAGGKVVKIDRIEWLAIPDSGMAANALRTGEIDFIEVPAPDLLPLLERDRNIRTIAINPVGHMVWLRVNHLHPPFNDPRARQALLFLVNQKDNLDAIGVPANLQVPYCPSYFMCGTPLESHAGAMGLREADIERARTLLREAGYDGRRIVFLNSADYPAASAPTLTMTEAFRRGGLNMEVQTTDWATVTQRRTRREAPEQGGWNFFVTVASALDAQNPLTNLYLASPCEGGLTGWPCDAELEALRRAWWEEPDDARRKAILEQVHARAYQVVPYINAGQFRGVAAYRANVEGLRPTMVPVFWGVEKK